MFRDVARGEGEYAVFRDVARGGGEYAVFRDVARIRWILSLLCLPHKEGAQHTTHNTHASSSTDILGQKE